MPVLPPEPDLFPEGLLADRTLLECAGRARWVLHARPRQEKSLARQVHGRHLSFYLSLVSRRPGEPERPMASVLLEDIARAAVG